MALLLPRAEPRTANFPYRRTSERKLSMTHRNEYSGQVGGRARVTRGFDALDVQRVPHCLGPRAQAALSATLCTYTFQASVMALGLVQLPQ